MADEDRGTYLMSARIELEDVTEEQARYASGNLDGKLVYTDGDEFEATLIEVGAPRRVDR